jgi:hypothetical protein
LKDIMFFDFTSKKDLLLNFLINYNDVTLLQNIYKSIDLYPGTIDKNSLKDIENDYIKKKLENKPTHLFVLTLLGFYFDKFNYKIQNEILKKNAINDFGFYTIFNLTYETISPISVVSSSSKGPTPSDKESFDNMNPSPTPSISEEDLSEEQYQDLQLQKKYLMEIIILLFYYNNLDSNNEVITSFNKFEVNIFDILDSFIQNKDTSPYNYLPDKLKKMNNIKLIKEGGNFNFFPIFNELNIKNYEDIDKVMDIIEDHLYNLELKDDPLMTVKTNYFLLLLMSGYLEKLLGKMKILKQSYEKFRDKKTKVFRLQKNQEIAIGKKFSFTGEKDIYYDILFYYYSKLYPDTPKYNRIFTNYDIYSSPVPSITLDKDLYDPHHKIFEDSLGDKFKEKKNEELESYYKFLDKENYTKLDTLNKLAENRNLELKNKNLSFDKTVEEFGGEVFCIIEELGTVYTQFYKNQNMGFLKNFLNNKSDKDCFKPDMIEAFTSPSPSPSDSSNDGSELSNVINPSPSSDNMGTFEKYMLLVKIILDILLRKNRIMYVGFIFIVLSLFIYFIDASDGYRPPPPEPRIKSIFDILRL